MPASVFQMNVEKFEKITIDSWRSNIDMQMNSIFVFCQKVLPHMATKKYGSVVNIGSIYGSVGPDFNVYNNTELTMPAAYSAIKGGIINFTKYLASYYGKDNIRVNCVSPGGIFNNQVTEFVKNGHAVLIEKNAGLGSSITDENYVQAGAKIIESVEKLWQEADLILKVKERC